MINKVFTLNVTDITKIAKIMDTQVSSGKGPAAKVKSRDLKREEAVKDVAVNKQIFIKMESRLAESQQFGRCVFLTAACCLSPHYGILAAITLFGKV